MVKKKETWLRRVDSFAQILEIVISIFLMLVIIVKLADSVIELLGYDFMILRTEFIAILRIVFNFVIGLEFVRLLCKHTPDALIDVLLFAIARYIIIYNETTFSLLLSIFAIGFLFIIKKYLVSPQNSEHQKHICECCGGNANKEIDEAR